MAKDKKKLSTSEVASDLFKNLSALSKSMKTLTDDSKGFFDKLSAGAKSVSSGINVYNDARKIFEKLSEKTKENGTNTKALGKVFSSVSEKMKSATDGIKDKFSSLSGTVKKIPDIFSSGFNKAKEHVGLFGQSIKTHFGNIKDKLSNVIFSGITSKLKELPGKAKDSISKMGSALSGGATTASLGAGRAISAGMVGGIMIAIAAVVGLIAIFKNLMETNEGFRSKVEETWAKIKETFQPVIDLIKDGVVLLMDVVAEVVDFISGLLTSIFEGISGLWSEHGEGFIAAVKEGWQSISDVVSQVFDFIATIVTTVIGVIKSLWDEYGTYIMAGITAVWDFISGIVNGALDFISGFLDIICGIFAGISDWFADKFSAGWNAIKGAFSGVGAFFSGIWDTIKSKFTSIGSAIGNAIGGAFKKVVNSIIGFAQTTINGFITAINASKFSSTGSSI